MKQLFENTKINYSHTVGFTADVGGRGFHLPRDIALNSENKLFVVSRSGAFHTAGLRITICDIKNNYFVRFVSLTQKNLFYKVSSNAFKK